MDVPDGFDELVDGAWPAAYAEPIGGWRARYAEGVTKRANSVLCTGDPGEVTTAIEAAERFYAGRGLPAVFQVSGAARPPRLDGLLAGRGYTLVDPTLVMVRELQHTRPDSRVVIGDAPTPRWLGLWWSVDGRYGTGLPAAERILTGVPAWYASIEEDGALLATGRAVPQGEWLGIYAMTVAPAARRRGLGREVLRALLARGRDQGRTRAYLAVVESNTAARALYEREGFRIAGRYHYRVRP
ncbi:GNAT family N-acetyltransferase [Actinomadura scrupuli]|uniref:GNAT family N-acetyltransferase n=1 Tax=Actinomadura scrupuli TaxID=559629 RepID=UPI003D958C6F